MSLRQWRIKEFNGWLTNERALDLYKKMGFKIEGLKEKSMIVDGKYVDEYYMGKIIDIREWNLGKS